MISKKRKIVIDRKFIQLLIIPLIIIAKIIRYTLMEKLIDYASGIKILNMILYPEYYPNGIETEGSFWVASCVFRAINIINLSTISQWEIYITIIFNIICVFFVSKCNKKIDLHQSVFLLCSIGLLNMFVFTLSKEIIQFVFFLLIYVVLSKEKLSYFRKIIASTSILIFCGAMYRTYFIIIAAFFILIIVLHRNLLKKPKVKTSLIVRTIFLYYCIFGSILFICNIIAPDILNEVIIVRQKTLYNLTLFGVDTYPASAIKEWLPNDNIFSFLANHFIITIRMLIPIELIPLGIKYIPFIIYQVLVTINLKRAIKTLKSNSNIRNLAIFIYLAFILGSAIFEPDYGSWVRHESASFPIMYFVIDSYRKKCKKKDKPKISILIERSMYG